MIPSSTLMTAHQVAGLLNLRPSTIYAAATRGQIPSVRLWTGKRRSVVRFDPVEIEKLIRGRSTATEQAVEPEHID